VVDVERRPSHERSVNGISTGERLTLRIVIDVASALPITLAACVVIAVVSEWHYWRRIR